MEADGDKLERLIKIVKDITWYQDGKHSIDSTIPHELGCEGADAEELIERVHEEFAVDFSDFEFYEYFVDETACRPVHLVALSLVLGALPFELQD